MLPYTEVLFRPGSRFSYSNPGIVYLGQVIERLSGEDFEVYVDKNILRPLGMHASYFDRTPPFLLPHRAHSYYHHATAGGSRAPFDVDTGVTVSNGGLNAPLTDMASTSPSCSAIGAPGRLRPRPEACVARGDVAAADFRRRGLHQGRMARTTQSGLNFFIDREGRSGSSATMAIRTGYRAYLSLCLPPTSTPAALLAFQHGNPRGQERTPPTAIKPPKWRIALATNRAVRRRWRAENLRVEVDSAAHGVRDKSERSGRGVTRVRWNETTRPILRGSCLCGASSNYKVPDAFRIGVELPLFPVPAGATGSAFKRSPSIARTGRSKSSAAPMRS
jgi:hypothetical protein